MQFEFSTKSELAALLEIHPRKLSHVLGQLARYYRPKKRLKSDGSFRTLLVPHGELKELQEKIKTRILDSVKWSDSVHGGIKGRSIVSNAKLHVGKPVVFCMDIKDCFPSIGPARVLRIFQRIGFNADAAQILTKLTTYEFQLPQGTHTSTALANLALSGVDLRIAVLAKAHGFTYSRYVDDITLSGSWRLLKFRGLLVRIIESDGFAVKPSKLETMHMGMRQVVTKLVVNGKINLPREKRESIHAELLLHLKSGSAQVAPSTLGRMQWLRYINPDSGKALYKRVRG